MFKPLAFTKTYAMASAALLSITIVPVLMGWFIRGKIKPEHANPLNRLLIRMYHPVVDFVLKWRKATLLVALALMVSIIWPLSRMGSEFMPPLYEGDLLYMPTTMPGVSITKAKEILQQTDRIIVASRRLNGSLGKSAGLKRPLTPRLCQCWKPRSC
jgi:Cu(I)/Ag(I) efflux system membrane protein CusA/SilA